MFRTSSLTLSPDRALALFSLIPRFSEVGVAVGALAEKTVANKQPVRNAAKGGQAKDTCIAS